MNEAVCWLKLKGIDGGPHTRWGHVTVRVASTSVRSSMNLPGPTEITIVSPVLLVVSGGARMRRRQLGSHSRWSARQHQGRPTRHRDLFAIGVEDLGRADGNGATAVNDHSLCH